LPFLAKYDDVLFLNFPCKLFDDLGAHLNGMKMTIAESRLLAYKKVAGIASFAHKPGLVTIIYCSKKSSSL
jgi:hypothetical protein